MAGEGEGISVVIRAPGSKFDVRVSLHMFVGELKFRIAPQCGIHESHQRLIYQKKIMDNNCTLGSYGVTEGTPIFVLKMLGPDLDMQQRDLEDMQFQLDQVLKDPVHIRYLFYIPAIQNLFAQSDDVMLACYLLLNGFQETDYADLDHFYNNRSVLRIILDVAYSISTMEEVLKAALVRTDPKKKAPPSKRHDPSSSTECQDPMVSKLIEDISQNPDNLIEVMLALSLSHGSNWTIFLLHFT